MQKLRRRPDVVLALFLFALCVLYALWGQRPLDYDEAAIFNPAYMVAKFSKISAPIWAREGGSIHFDPGLLDHMWIHPPVHYLVLGYVMKLMPLYYAEAVAPTILFAFCLYFGTTLRAGIYERLAYLLTAFVFVVLCVAMQSDNFSVRPNMSATLAWYAGMLGMERSRREGWSLLPLAIGSLLAVYGSTLHYITAFYVFSPLVYVVAAYRETGRTHFLKALAAIAIGGCIVGIPYLVGFLIPLADKIHIWLTQASASNTHGHNPWVIFLFKLQYNSENSLWFSSTPFFRSYPGALMKLYVPIGLVSSLGLVLIRPTRLIGIATLPQILFLYFVADKTQPFYLITEYLVVFLVTFVVAAWVIGHIEKRLRALSPEATSRLPEGAITCLLAVVFAAHLSSTEPKFRHAVRNIGTYSYHWMDAARAASQTIVGPQGVVGDFGTIWYFAGSRYWFPIEYGRIDKPPEDETRYFAAPATFAIFNLRAVPDMVVERIQGNPKERYGELAGFYAKGMIGLQGAIQVPGSGVAFFSNVPQGRHLHYQINTDLMTVEQFETTPAGDMAYGTFLCVDADAMPRRSLFEHLNIYPTFLELNGSNPQFLGVFRTTAQNLAVVRTSISAGCQLKEAHLGIVTTYSFAEFITSSAEFHRDVDFYRTRDAAVAARQQR